MTEGVTLYGEHWATYSKVHRVLHLYEGTGEYSEEHGLRHFHAAFGLLGTLKHFNNFPAERLQKDVKACARMVYRAKHANWIPELRGTDNRAARMHSVLVERFLWRLASAPDELQRRRGPAGLDPTGTRVEIPTLGQCATSCDTFEMGTDRSVQKGDWWWYRRAEQPGVLGRVEGLFAVEGGGCVLVMAPHDVSPCADSLPRCLPGNDLELVEPHTLVEEVAVAPSFVGWSDVAAGPLVYLGCVRTLAAASEHAAGGEDAQPTASSDLWSILTGSCTQPQHAPSDDEASSGSETLFIP